MSEPILIVGAGPTGLTAALELSRMGVPVRLIDKREAPATTLLVNAADESARPVNLRGSAPDGVVHRIGPSATGADPLNDVLGAESVTLVRPDGYAALTSSLASAASHLDAYRRKWMASA